jgi:hypothetical protein
MPFSLIYNPHRSWGSISPRFSRHDDAVADQDEMSGSDPKQIEPLMANGPTVIRTGWRNWCFTKTAKRRAEKFLFAPIR